MDDGGLADVAHPSLARGRGGDMARRGAVEALDRLGAGRFRCCGLVAEMGAGAAGAGCRVRLRTPPSAKTGSRQSMDARTAVRFCRLAR